MRHLERRQELAEQAHDHTHRCGIPVNVLSSPMVCTGCLGTADFYAVTFKADGTDRKVSNYCGECLAEGIK